MRLRNKNTGHVFNFAIIASQDNTASYFILKTGSGGWEDGLTYGTLEELHEEWEDYKPKEPLIKDENVRETVRAWAKALGLQKVHCASNGYEIYGGIDDWVIQFDGEPFPFADKNKIYTITELCGAPGPLEPTLIDLDERIKEKEEE